MCPVFLGAGKFRRRGKCARGHHAWYSGSGGYPEDYVRIDSPYRKMTDLVAVVSFISENYKNDIFALREEIRKLSDTAFSPFIVSFLEDDSLLKKIEEVLTGERKQYYLELYEELRSDKKEEV